MPLQTLRVTVPAGASPGSTLALSVGGRTIAVTVPADASPGSTLELAVDLPGPGGEQDAEKPAQAAAAAAAPAPAAAAAAPAECVSVSVTVPAGAGPGDTLHLSVRGQTVAVTVPEGAAEGTALQFQVELSKARTDADRAVDAAEGGEDTSDAHPGDEGPTYTSGEDDDSGPAILSPAQWHRRHPSPSRYRRTVRAYRTHYFHNQKDGDLVHHPGLAALMAPDAAVDPELRIDRVSYADAAARADAFDRWCVGDDGRGCPVVLTAVPRAQETMAALGMAALRHPTWGQTRFRVCVPFTWGSAENTMDGRLELRDYFRLVTEHPNADVPFYVFENDIGGRRHTQANYGDVDAWAYGAAASDVAVAVGGGCDGQKETGLLQEAAVEQADGEANTRGSVAGLYAPPALFAKCMLRVPYQLRPRSTDGVLLVGCQRTGSYPHTDPNHTGAWNWMLEGVKRWVLFPPHVPRDVIVGKDAAAEKAEEQEGPSSTNLTGTGCAYWWAYEYPRLKARARELGMVEVLQRPGELIYVPQNWWHAVLNVTEWSVAVTHNVVLPRALPGAFDAASRDDPVFARRWWACLKRFAPQEAARVPIDAVARCLREAAQQQGSDGNHVASGVAAKIDDALDSTINMAVA